MAKPAHPGIGITTGTAAAATHPSWKRVSKRAKARPRLASGASRCTIESNARRASAALKPTTHDSSAAVERPPKMAAIVPPTAVKASAATSIRSSRSCWRTIGPTALPASVPMAENASTTPNHAVGVPVLRNQKAIWNVRNPTTARSSAIADAARRMPPERSSAASTGCSRSAATTMRFGMFHAITAAPAKISAENATVACGLMTCRAIAGTMAMKPTSPAMSPSFEFASTSSLSLRTTLGTSSALLRDRVRLRQHQRGEGQREQGQAVEVGDHEDADDRLADGADDHDDAPPARHPVDGRPHERRHDREGQHREDQVERDPRSRRARADVEEQRAGEGEGDDSITRRHEGVGAGQAGERRKGQDPRHPGGPAAGGRGCGCLRALGPYHGAPVTRPW